MLLPLFSLSVCDAVGHCVVTADVICRRVTGGFRVSTCKLNSKEHEAERHWAGVSLAEKISLSRVNLSNCILLTLSFKVNQVSTVVWKANC